MFSERVLVGGYGSLRRVGEEDSVVELRVGGKESGGGVRETGRRLNRNVSSSEYL